MLFIKTGVHFLLDNKDICSLITSIGTTIIAMLAFMVSLSELRAQRRMTKNSIKPICIVDAKGASNCEMIISIANAGNGAMRLDSCTYLYNGENYSTLQDIFQFAEIHNGKEWNYDREYVLANSFKIVYEDRFHNYDETLKAWQVLSKVEINICYADTFGKKGSICWKFEPAYYLAEKNITGKRKNNFYL